MDEYRPGLTVRVLGLLPQPLTDRLLRLPNGETASVLERPDEYVGYVCRSTIDEVRVGSILTVFSRGLLDVDRRYLFLADASVFDVGLRLFRSTVASRIGDGGREV